MSAPLPPAVVLGLSPTGLYVARELGRAGVPLLGVDREFACGSLSRFFRRSHGVWHEQTSSALLARLLRFSGQQDSTPVLIPTSDHYIEFIAENYAELARCFHVSSSYENLAARVLDKLGFHALCSQHGVECPRVWRLSGSGDSSGVLDEVPVPCILKPSLIHVAKPFMRGRKVLVAETRDDLVELVRNLPPETGGWFIQEIVPGEESRITLLAGYAGENASGSNVFTARKLRQFPPGFGNASRVISEHCDETRDITVRFIEAIGLTGIYGAEFKRDPRDGKLKIIEINPRPTLWFHASHAAGKRLVLRAYSDLAGLPPPASQPQRVGVLWQYALKDLASAVYYRANRRGAALPPPDIAAGGPTEMRCWPVYSVTDPLPSLGELYVYGTRLLRRLL